MYYIHLQRWYVKIVLTDAVAGLGETQLCGCSFSSFQRSAPAFSFQLPRREKICDESKTDAKKRYKILT